MGIDKLWDEVKKKGCGRSMSIDQFKTLFRTDQIRVAIDANWIIVKNYAKSWSDSIKAGNFDIEDIATRAVKSIIMLDKFFTGNQIDTIWCIDGDRSKAKLATERRHDTKKNARLAIIEKYRMCHYILKRLSTPKRERFDDEEDDDTIPPGDPVKIAQCYNKLQQLSFIEELYIYISDNIPAAEVGDAEITTDKVMELLEQLKKDLTYMHIFPKGFYQRVFEALGKNDILTLRVPSVSEGEKLGCILIEMGYCQAIYSADGDTIPLGARCIITKLEGRQMMVYTYSEILKKLDLDRTELIHYCILLGTDFNEHVFNVGGAKAYAKIKDPKFNIYKYNIENGGCLKVNQCIRELTIDNIMYHNVLKGLEGLQPEVIAQRAVAGEEQFYDLNEDDNRFAE